jgi:hypothetical protein
MCATSNRYPNGDIKPLRQLKEYSITGHSAEMRQQMLEDIFLLQDIALLGQWTTLYAAPNTGKTLLALWLLKEALDIGSLDGDFVFYVNADDTFRGIVEKTELAEQWGFHMIAPNQRGFHTAEVTDLMVDLVEAGEARGVIIILDTLKKFTDLMHKKVSTEFGIISRSFVSSGGTLICLAHTNKHKNSEGKSIYSGTSDIRDDSDCAFIIDKIEGGIFDYEVAVEFVNDKARGDVADKVSFSYSKKNGQTYADLVNSVKRIDDQKAGQLKTAAQDKKKLDEDQELINAVRKSISAGITSKSAIVKNVGDETGISQNKIRKTLAERTGNAYDFGDRWSVSTGAHNKSEYSVLNPFTSAEGVSD